MKTGTRPNWMRWARGKNSPAGAPVGVFQRIARFLGGWRARAVVGGKPLGRQGEDVAARYLKRQGYRILERNRFLGRNEIDIIAQEGDTIAFVEVRTRRVLDEIPPEDTVGPAKQRQLRKAADRYISLYGDESLYYRFDVVGVILPERGKPQIRLYRNAFEG